MIRSDGQEWWPLSTPPRHRYLSWVPDLSDLGAELDERRDNELRRAMDRLERQSEQPGRDLASEHTISWVRLAADRVLDTCDAIDEFVTDDRQLTARAASAREDAESSHRRADEILAANR